CNPHGEHAVLEECWLALLAHFQSQKLQSMGMPLRTVAAGQAMQSQQQARMVLERQ
ncbi:hypothetical protein H0H87_001520, partial [Tephrocybe sp. NHM501043]